MAEMLGAGCGGGVCRQGAGKTHTMEGEFNDPIEAGLIPNSFRYIFERIESQSEEKQFLISVSYLEIYNENIWDLLVPRGDSGLQLKENKDYGVYVQDLKTVIVSNKEEMVGVLSRGKKNRVTGATAMNDKSSRSHAIFTVAWLRVCHSCAALLQPPFVHPLCCTPRGKDSLLDCVCHFAPCRTCKAHAWGVFLFRHCFRLPWVLMQCVFVRARSCVCICI